MINVALVFLGIVVLFAVFIFLRSAFSLKICALCGAVLLAWAILLTLFLLGYRVDPVLLSLLIGGSIVGSTYTFEQKLSEKYQLFKLSYFLTCVYVVYAVLIKNIQIEVVYLLVAVWAFGILIYFGKRIESIKAVGQKIIECCKNW